jgi:hypothetical protein
VRFTVFNESTVVHMFAKRDSASASSVVQFTYTPFGSAEASLFCGIPKAIRFLQDCGIRANEKSDFNFER